MNNFYLNYILKFLKIFFFIILSIIIGCNNENYKKFPELKPVCKSQNDFKWQFINGPDFYIYRGTIGSTNLPYVSIYFGLHPNLKSQGNSKKYNGIIAGEKINWLTVSNSKMFEQEAVFLYKKSPEYVEIKIHIWIIGKNEDELNKLKENLKEIKFIKRSNENI